MRETGAVIEPESWPNTKNAAVKSSKKREKPLRTGSGPSIAHR
jgi:hypothetical protein